MKNLVLASILGSAATAFAVPALSGPVHFAITRPHSMFGWAPASPNPTGMPVQVSVALGVAPLDFILTDVMIGETSLLNAMVTVNGAPVLATGTSGGNPYSMSQHLSSGVFIPAGSTVGLTAMTQSASQTAITVAGYVQ